MPPMPAPFKFNSFAASRAGRRPRLKLPPEMRKTVEKKRRENGNRSLAHKPSDDDGVDSFISAKLKKEQGLADKAEQDAELRRMEIEKQRGELVPVDDVKKQLESEHTLWLTAIEEWRQSILKKIARLGIPVEMQESISEMIAKEITEMRQKRAVAE